MPKSFSEIVDLWPSFAAMADDIGAKANTVAKWHLRDRISPDCWLAVAEAAERRGYDGVTVDLMARLAAGTRANTAIAADR